MRFKLPFIALAATFLSTAIFFCNPATAQQSVARQWNEVLLEGIRHDYARPTVHARNLFHVSTLMYDAWAAYEPTAKTYFLGDTLGGFVCPFNGVPTPGNVQAAQEEAMSYATYRLLNHRFLNSPGAAYTLGLADSLMNALGYPTTYTSAAYANGQPAALGNYLAQFMIAFGLQDGSNESADYGNQYYTANNTALVPTIPGNPTSVDPNNWQPLTLQTYIDQSGNVIPINTPPFLSPEWGNVVPFSLTDADKTVYNQGPYIYNVFHDPGLPPMLSAGDIYNGNEDYKWGFSLVSIWSAHLDPNDTTMWDISPASIGNLQSFPTNFADYPNFYDLYNGGDNSPGHAVNPTTGQPYTPQMVRRGDYARVLAEFWADGPESETPPGHWFTLLNYVSDQPTVEKKWRGSGPALDALEWDVKSYFSLGGAMHDAAICAWSIKGWYDYARPISAIRYMADRGQCTDTTLANFSELGIPLHPGYIEVVDSTDTLAGNTFQHVGKIKILAWKGPDYITDPLTDVAAVDWILAENWWPYQRPTFITPPFAGYISGHSTYSRAAAEVLTEITGDPYFPEGMGAFKALADTFLVFEDGPSTNVNLQWATYRDASDQCSLSRIWGGIHPPADDIPGRLIGMELGPEVVTHSEFCFDPNGQPDVLAISANIDTISDVHAGAGTFMLTVEFNEAMDTTVHPVIVFPQHDPTVNTLAFASGSWVNGWTYNTVYDVFNSNEVLDSIEVTVALAQSADSVQQAIFTANNVFWVETENPSVAMLWCNDSLLSDPDTSTQALYLYMSFSEAMSMMDTAQIAFPADDAIAGGLMVNAAASSWIDSVTYIAAFDFADADVLQTNITAAVTGVSDRLGNVVVTDTLAAPFSIDSENPIVASATPVSQWVWDGLLGTASFEISAVFSEAMDEQQHPELTFPGTDPTTSTLVQNTSQSAWASPTEYVARFAVIDGNVTLPSIDVQLDAAYDVHGNLQVSEGFTSVFGIDTENPAVTAIGTNLDTVTLQDVGPAAFMVAVTFSEDMDQSASPIVEFPVEDPTQVLTMNSTNSQWVSSTSFEAWFDVAATPTTLLDVDVRASGYTDLVGNAQLVYSQANAFSIVVEDSMSSSVSGNLAHANLRVYPNPVQGGNFQVAVQLEGRAAALELRTVSGQIVWEKAIAASAGSQPVQLTGPAVAAGIYLLRLTTPAGQLTQRITVLH